MLYGLTRGDLRIKQILAALAALIAFALPAAAQTVTLTDSSDTTLRAGAYANTNYGSSTVLETRASDNADYHRRVLVKFDTHNTIPSGSSVQSATLTLTVKGGNAETRTLDAFRETSPYTDTEATWNVRRTSTAWSQPGGDLAEKIASSTVTNTTGSKVTFNVTAAVQAIVSGKYGTRYTRIMLIDRGASSRDSYKQYDSEQAGGGLGPVLTVVLGPASSPPTTPPPSTSGTTLRFFEYNTHHGVGTDGVYNIDRIASVVAKYNPDVVVLIEVEKYTGWGNEDQPERYKSLLQSKTGRTWYYVFAQEYGDWSANGKGNLLLSRFPFTKTDRHYLSTDRTVALGEFTVNGRNITAMATHLDPYDQGIRYTQATQLMSYASGWSENKMISGDMNAWPDQTSIGYIDGYYNDAWTKAEALGTASYYGSYSAGQTRSGRIDYIFYSKQASYLKVQKMQLIDSRDSNGVMPSDHRPIMATFTVQ